MALVVVDGAGELTASVSMLSDSVGRHMLPVAADARCRCCQQNRIRDAASAAALVTVGGSG